MTKAIVIMSVMGGLPEDQATLWVHGVRLPSLKHSWAELITPMDKARDKLIVGRAVYTHRQSSVHAQAEQASVWQMKRTILSALYINAAYHATTPRADLYKKSELSCLMRTSNLSKMHEQP